MARKITVKAHTRYDGVRVPAHTRTRTDRGYTAKEVERNINAARNPPFDAPSWQYVISYARTGGVTLRDRQGNRIAYAGGGGYDKTGTVVGQLLSKEFGDRLGKLKPNTGSGDPYGPTSAYGVRHRDINGTTYGAIDGATGINNVISVAEKIGVRVTVLDAGKDRNTLLVTDGLGGTR